MIEMYLLEQLDALAQHGTLLAASEILHITQPSMSRAMKKLEETMGVPLFEHRGNRLTLNEYGRIAAEYARRILDSQDEMISRIRALERSKRTILLGSCAPGPLMELPSILSSLYPDQTISTELRTEEELLTGLSEHVYQMVILIHKPENTDIRAHLCGEEHLYCGLPLAHPLAEKKSISFSEMDSENFLMASEVGFWDQVVRTQMPHSRFLLQNDPSALSELVSSSSLPSFATDITLRLYGKMADRAFIPFSDTAAVTQYWCCCRKEEELKYLAWFQALERRK